MWPTKLRANNGPVVTAIDQTHCVGTKATSAIGKTTNGDHWHKIADLPRKTQAARWKGLTKIEGVSIRSGANRRQIGMLLKARHVEVFDL